MRTLLPLCFTKRTPAGISPIPGRPHSGQCTMSSLRRLRVLEAAMRRSSWFFMPQAVECLNGADGGISYLLVPVIFGSLVWDGSSTRWGSVVEEQRALPSLAGKRLAYANVGFKLSKFWSLRPSNSQLGRRIADRQQTPLPSPDYNKRPALG
jgi:hypothetical protein